MVVCYNVVFKRNDKPEIEFSYVYVYREENDDIIAAMMDALNRANQYLQKANGTHFDKIVRIEEFVPNGI